MARSTPAKTAAVEDKKQLAVKPSTALAVADDYEGSATGFENQTRADIAIPFIHILQGLSPKVVADPRTYFPGQLINSVTGDVIEGNDGILFVPAYTKHVYVEWKPRASGGGFVGEHAVDSDVVRNALAVPGVDRNKLTLGANELHETFLIFGIMCDGEDPVTMAVISITSTKIKSYRGWNTRLRTHMIARSDGRKINPPIFANLTRIRTKSETNTKGTFFNFDFQPENNSLAESLLSKCDPRFMAAQDCYKMVTEGTANADYASSEQEPAGAPEKEVL